MLELRDVRLVHNPGTPGEVTALDGLSLSVPKGQFVAIVGSNGAGKSSLIQIVSGTLRPTSGTVVIGGRDVTRQGDHRRARHVARVFDNPHLGSVPELSIEDNMALALRRGGRRGLRPAVTKAHRALMRDRLAMLGLGLETRLSAPVRLLSAGQRQSLTMIMAALTAPEVLLLDEHLAALDPGTQSRVLELTLDLAADLGCTTLMITHNMDHATTVGDRLLVLSGGRLASDLTAESRGALTSDALTTLLAAA
ncbi:putative ABC transport system ATP-binding protein [Actinocorallia herbida]|uniref:Putative ABC transport system ATP-binding protein n=1 Tax=Actinocorallia herbida TaxID=58109 RepID=A0A3N1CP34_9ACTN|nr:ATP-binding cassette domain-containing protein [Actinocorallia herbida]ROO82955.1 putative ABC transport system ATP-binding protein [Actinocorallia herbida]